jgi:hypothetical protein
MSACNVTTLTGRFSWGFYYHWSTRADFDQNRSDLCAVSLETLLLYTPKLFTGIYCVRYLKRELPTCNTQTCGLQPPHRNQLLRHYRITNEETNIVKYDHRVFLLLVGHRASMKSFQPLRSPAVSLTSFHDLRVFLISSSVVLRHVLSAYLFFYTPEDSNLMQVSLLLLLLYVMCVLSNFIFFFLSEFLLASVW